MSCLPGDRQLPHVQWGAESPRAPEDPWRAPPAFPGLSGRVLSHADSTAAWVHGEGTDPKTEPALIPPAGASAGNTGDPVNMACPALTRDQQLASSSCPSPLTMINPGEAGKAVHLRLPPSQGPRPASAPQKAGGEFILIKGSEESPRSLLLCREDGSTDHPATLAWHSPRASAPCPPWSRELLPASQNLTCGLQMAAHAPPPHFCRAFGASPWQPCECSLHPRAVEKPKHGLG